MGYPTSYRNSASRAARMGGYQRPSDGPALPRPGDGTRLPVPANDNLPVPANDNLAARRAEREAAEYFGEKVGLRIAGRVATRFIPIIGEALLAYDLYRLYRDLGGAWMRGDMLRGWHHVKSCRFQLSSGWQVTGFHWMKSTFNGTVCLTGQADTGVPNWQTGTDAVWVRERKAVSVGLTSRDYWETYHRSKPFAPQHYGAVQPPAFPARFPASAPAVPWPSLDPASLPINAPVAPPLPIPFSVLPGVLPDPLTGSETSYGPDAGAGVTISPALPPLVVTLPGVGAIEVPVDEALPPVASVGHSPRVRVEGSSRHEFRPNRPREKQRKFIAALAPANLLVSAFNRLTEVQDFISALYWALPKSDRLPVRWVKRSVDGRWVRVKPNLADMAMVVWTHADDIDLRTAAKNLIVNEIGDRRAARAARQQVAAVRHVYETGYGAPARPYTLSRRGTGGLVNGSPISDSVDWAFDQIWPE